MDPLQPGQTENAASRHSESRRPSAAAAEDVSRVAWAGVLAVVAAGFVLWKSWVCDDAFITFRHVANLLEGHGPVFNPGERVQAFTHPLWFGLLAGGARLFDVYVVAVGGGVLLTAGLFAFLGWRSRGERHRSVRLLFVFTVLLSSKTFVEFQTSGLENALSNLLVVVLSASLGHAWLMGTAFPAVLAAWLCGLLVLNRPDHAVVVAPVAVAACVHTVRGGDRGTWLGVLSAALPVLGWYGFATIYYGTPLPNTAYAKVVMPWGQSFPMGLQYLLDYALYEPLHAVVLLVGIALGLYVSVRDVRRRRSGASIPGILALALAMHLVYVAAVGGDYMRGRFVDVALVGSAVLVMALLGRWLPAHDLSAPLTVSVAVFGGLLFLRQMQSPRVLEGLGRGIEWVQYGLAKHSALPLLLGLYPAVVMGLLLVLRRSDRRWSQAVFGGSVLAATVLLIGLLGYRPPAWPVVGVLAAAGLCVAYALAMGVSGAGLPMSGNVAVCVVIAAAASLCDIDRRSESGSGALSDEFSCYHVRGWHNPFRHPVGALRGTTARWRQIGLTARRYAEQFGPLTVAYDSLGVISYYSGPQVRVIDLCGLAEPYLNRCGVPPVRRAGHVAFEIPAGYLETRGAVNLLPGWYDRLERMDPTLAADAAAMRGAATWQRSEDRRRWEATQRIIAGELFSPARWADMPAYIRPERKYVTDGSACLRRVATLAPPMQ